MQLIAVVVAVNIVTDDSTIAEAEHLSGLLADCHAGCNFSRAVALSEFIRISISLNSRAELLSRHQVQILDVIRVNRRRLRTGGAFGNSGKTIPGNALIIKTAGLNRVENAMVYAGFVQTFTGFIPNKFTHRFVPPC